MFFEEAKTPYKTLIVKKETFKKQGTSNINNSAALLPPDAALDEPNLLEYQSNTAPQKLSDGKARCYLE
jgi:hypothetical protein